MILFLPGRLERAGLLVAVAALCACNAAPSTSTTASSAYVRTTAASVPATPVPSPAAPSANARVALSACAAPRDVASLHVVHRFSVSPDDITVDGAGRVWVTARETNLLVGMSADGTAVTTQSVAGGPEGVAADGSTLYVAQQLLNVVAAVGPPLRRVATLPARTGQDGVDGIAWDAQRGELLLPDSPTGQMYTMRPDAPSPTLVASGLGRPVAAVTDPGGDMFIASESSPGLTELSVSGARTSLGHFADLDEVVWYRGLLYVTELDKRDVVAVDPGSGASVAVAVNLPAPQGLAVTAAGVLEIVDASNNALYSMPSCGVQES